MGFLHPELLLLLVPAAAAWWALREREFWTDCVRAVALVLIVLALARPYLETAQEGRDLVFVVDRSRSMPDGAQQNALELVQLAEEARRDGDRVAVVSFGAGAALERLPSETARFSAFERSLDRDGSDLGEAIETALDLIPRDRPGSIVVLSDGEANGRDPVDAARRAFARGVRVDVRAFPRAGKGDLSVERIDLPDEVAAREPFQFSVWVRSDRRVEADFVLKRDGEAIARGHRVFEPGVNRIALRDVLDAAGVAQYEVELASDDDRIAENNRGLGALQVGGARAILLVNDDGAEDVLARALRAAKLPVKTVAPEGARLDALALTAYRAVILENVAAGRFGTNLKHLNDFVTERGGGVLVTGGRASFGTGGYFKSTLDPLLPVSMEMRQEHRKQAIALSITMDRSGSMAMPAGAGLTKMDLANLGAAAAIELLSPIDSVGVIAVDSSPHVFVDLQDATDVSGIVARVRRIRSEGGGVFSYTALLAAGQMLEDAEQVNRHVIFFADAADAEEHEGCEELVPQMLRAGITTSVIALGTEADADATFLKRVAELGQGQCYFTLDPSELPRLFAQDTLTAARATFIEEKTATRVLPDLFGLGEVPQEGFVELDGYNLTYLREGAVCGVVTSDDYKAPAFAFHYQGLGRVAAYTGQIGGTYGAPLVAWPGFESFFVSVARWLVGQEEPGDLFATVRREGKDAVIQVEQDPEAGVKSDTSRLVARVTNADGTKTTLELERTGENRFEARFPMEKEGIALGTLALADGKTVALPPVALPYSPEFEPSPDPQRGERLLRKLAEESNGVVGVGAAEFWRGERAGHAWRVIARELILAALLALLAEIAIRRLQLGNLVRMPAFVTRWRAERAARRALRPATAASASTTPSAPAPTPAGTTAAPTAAPAAAPQARGPAPSVSDALEKARRAAGKRLDR
ncbi:MAG: VWA domain-containing protein [Planctomycetes bacterium]|nr:VWA domain-containing protein [Planctomycetota bacterium]